MAADGAMIGIMPLPIELKRVETLVFRSEVVAMGTFRCAADHPMFRDSGPCPQHTVVFPRSSTIIRHAGSASFTATPNCATLYNQHQEYTRTRVSPIDASDWYVIADDILLEGAPGDDRRPFRRSHVPIDSATYMRQRRLFESVSHRELLSVDEEAIAIIAHVLRSSPSRSVAPSMRDKVEAAKSMISAAPSRRFSLRQLAAAAGSSPFHLCHAFRNLTGMSITSYQHGLRLRIALDWLRDTQSDLSDIALRLGFASHSHFTALFRRHFGVTPSQFRAH